MLEAFFATGRRKALHAVGDRLGPRQGDRTRGEGPSQHVGPGQAGEPGDWPSVGELAECRLVHGHGGKPFEQHAEKADPAEQRDGEDVAVGWNGEEPPRFPRAAQVRIRHEGDDPQRNPDLVREQPVKGGGDRGHSRRHGDGDRQRVVDQQRRTSQQPHRLAEVVESHDVGAAGGGVGVDGLAVARHDDPEKDHDDDRQRHEEAQRRHRGDRHEDDEHLLGGIRRGGDGV